MKDIEQNIVDALLGAAAFRTERNTATVRIIRDDTELFSFEVGGLTEDEFNRCRKLNTKNRGKRDEETDWSRYAAQVIYEATSADDKKRIWQNKEAWERFNVASGVDVVNYVLMPAEKSKILETIESLSGFNDDLDNIIQKK